MLTAAQDGLAEADTHGRHVETGAEEKGFGSGKKLTLTQSGVNMGVLQSAAWKPLHRHEDETSILTAGFLNSGCPVLPAYLHSSLVMLSSPLLSLQLSGVAIF